MAEPELTVHVLDPRGFSKSMCGRPLQLGREGGVYVHWGNAEQATCETCKMEAEQL